MLLYCAGGGMGDSLVSTLVARALRARYDTVDALTLPGHRTALERVPDLDDVLVDDGGDERALAAALRARAYDACVVTWATARTAKVAHLAGIPVRVGQARRLYSFRFTKRVVVRSEKGDVTSHWGDIQLDYARALGCDTDDRIPGFVPTPDDEREADALLASLGVSPGAYIIMHPTNAEAPKRGNWPTQGWAALARALHAAFNLPILISGSPADAAINATLLRQAQDDTSLSKGPYFDVAGALGIGGFGALAARARGFVGITTGSMHVAAAVGTPTVGIFPFQSDFPERWAPSGMRTAVVRPSYPCHPGDTKENCRDYACIAHLDVPRIVAVARELLDASPEPSDAAEK